MFYHLSTPKREKEFDQMTNTRYIIESENKKRAWKVSFKSRLTTSRPPSYFSTSNKFISNSNDHSRPLSLRQPPSPSPPPLTTILLLPPILLFIIGTMFNVLTKSVCGHRWPNNFLSSGKECIAVRSQGRFPSAFRSKYARHVPAR